MWANTKLGFLACFLGAIGVWVYAERVLVPYQIADATAHDHPRGNLSDLYPRWIGARALLTQGRDPYSAEVTREIQLGYWGRILDPSRQGDPKDQQAFAYPLYVVFYLAPSIHLRFQTVQIAFFWMLVALTVASVSLWLRVVNWRIGPWLHAGTVALVLGSLPVLQGLKLQQLSLLVAAMLAAAVALLVAGRPVPAGVLLALATIKPQLLLPLLVWLGLWTLGDLGRRYRWAMAFVVCLAILFAASEYFLPHWLQRFWQAVVEYRRYTGAEPVMNELLPKPWGRLPELGLTVVAAMICWRNRRCAEDSRAFAVTTSLVLALTLLVMPTYSPYNQVLLLPGILSLARDGPTLWRRSRGNRILLAVNMVLLTWPYLSAGTLALLSFVLPPATVEKAWAVPGWTILTLPIGVAALMLLYAYRQSFASPVVESQ